MREALLDANVLLRYLLDEPRDLADRAANILEAADRQRIRLVVTALTVGEVVYVLESVYGWQRRAVADKLLDLLSAGLFNFPEQDALARALAWYRDHGALHFADAYVASVAVERGDRTVISFDRGLRKLRDVSVVESPEGLSRN